MNPLTRKFTQEEHNAIIDAIRATLEDTKHHATYGHGTRFQKILKAKLPEDYRVTCTSERIEVWQECASNTTQGAWFNNYEQRVSLYFPWHYADPAKILVKICEDLNRCDTRDCAERRQQEQENYGAFRSLAQEAADLLGKLIALRAIASDIVKDLPIPTAATVRKSSVHWDRPSPELRAKFPNLFPA